MTGPCCVCGCDCLFPKGAAERVVRQALNEAGREKQKGEGGERAVVERMEAAQHGSCAPFGRFLDSCPLNITWESC